MVHGSSLVTATTAGRKTDSEGSATQTDWEEPTSPKAPKYSLMASSVASGFRPPTKIFLAGSFFIAIALLGSIWRPSSLCSFCSSTCRFKQICYHLAHTLIKLARRENPAPCQTVADHSNVLDQHICIRRQSTCLNQICSLHFVTLATCQQHCTHSTSMSVLLQTNNQTTNISQTSNKDPGADHVAHEESPKERNCLHVHVMVPGVDSPCLRWQSLWRERSRSLGTGPCWSPSWWCSLTLRQTYWSNPSGPFYSCPSSGRPQTFYCRQKRDNATISSHS